MKRALTAGLLLLLAGSAAAAQGGPPGGALAFPQVTAVPVPLQSASGRYSSLNPPNRLDCPYAKVTGRVVSPRLVLVKEFHCGRPGHDNVLVNILFADPADSAQMIPGRRVVIGGKFTSAQEDRDELFFAEFLVAEKAVFVSGEPIAAPAAPFTSYMLCQPPELDALAARLGKELCIQNTLLSDLAAIGPMLETAARGPAKLAAGDAAGAAPISCRLDPGISDLHLPAVSCAKASYWAWYRSKWRDTRLATPAPP